MSACNFHCIQFWLNFCHHTIQFHGSSIILFVEFLIHSQIIVTSPSISMLKINFHSVCMELSSMIIFQNLIRNVIFIPSATNNVHFENLDFSSATTSNYQLLKTYKTQPSSFLPFIREDLIYTLNQPVETKAPAKSVIID